ncbi:MAG: hypothetical protein V5B34_09395 [Accumulibacter sp.]
MTAELTDRIELDAGTWATLRETPWDARVFGFRCVEILELAATDASSLGQLLARLDAVLQAANVHLAYTRVDGAVGLLKRGLQEAGFYFAEASYRLSHRRLALTTRFDQLIRPGPELVAAGPQELAVIRDILQEDFDHGRLHEDPYVPRERAGLRYRNWVDDLVAQHHEIYAYVLKGKVVGLHVQRCHGSIADLVLTGVARSHALLGLPLWAQAIRLIREQGMTEMHTVISAANLPIMNLYRHFDFSFDALLCGYHKRYPPVRPPSTELAS